MSECASCHKAGKSLQRCELCDADPSGIVWQGDPAVCHKLCSACVSRCDICQVATTTRHHGFVAVRKGGFICERCAHAHETRRYDHEVYYWIRHCEFQDYINCISEAADMPERTELPPLRPGPGQTTLDSWLAEEEDTHMVDAAV